MKFIEGYFPGFDGTRLYYRFLPAASPSSSWLIGLHGHGEHTGRYVKFGQHLGGRDLNIAFFDMRGYGQSEGRDVYVDSFEDFKKDLSAFHAFLKKEYQCPEKFILFAHSLGGLIALYWARQFPANVRALILSSPCLGLKIPALLVRFNQFLNLFAPKLVYSNPVYPPHLTHNLAEVEEYKKDTLIKRRISVRLLAEMVRATLRWRQEPKLDFPFPVFIVMAGLEKIVDPAATRLFFERVEAPRKNLIVFDDFYHEIFNEQGQEQAFKALQNCLEEVRTLGY